MTRALENARDALPPPPSEWVLVSDDQISVPAGLCMDRPGPFSYSFGRAYGNRSPQNHQTIAAAQAGDQAKADSI